MILGHIHPERAYLWPTTVEVFQGYAGGLEGQVLFGRHRKSRQQSPEGVKEVMGGARCGSGWDMSDNGIRLGHGHVCIVVERENGGCMKRCDWTGGGESARKGVGRL